MGARLLLAFGVLILLLVLFSAWSFRRAREERRTVALRETTQSARTVGAFVHGVLRDLDSTSVAVSAALGRQVRPIDQETTGPYLATIKAEFPHIRAIFVTDPAGTVIASSGNEGIGRDVSARPYIQALQGGQEFVLSDVISGLDTQRPTITLARTIRDPAGALRGLLVVAFYPDQLALLLPGALPADATVTVFDRSGALVFSVTGAPPAEASARGFIERVEHIAVVPLERIERLVAPSGGDNRVTALVPVAQYGWAVGASRTLEAIEAPVQRYHRRQLLALGLLVGIASLLSLVLSRALAKPLVRLAEQARAFGQGAREITVPASGPTEVRTLATALNQMAAEVQARFAEREAATAARRQSEERLQRVFDTAAAGIQLWDRDGRFVMGNAAAARFVGLPDGYPDGLQYDHAPYRRFTLDGRPFPLEEHPFAQVKRTGRPVEGIEFAIERPDGSRVIVSANAAPLWDANQAFAGVVMVLIDITEREAAAAALREEREIAETLYRIGTVVAAELDTGKVVQAVTDAATRLSGAQFGAFFFNKADEQGEAYTLFTLSGVPREHFERFPMPRNTPVFEPTFRGTEVVRADDITQDPRFGQNPPYHGLPPGHLPVRSYLAVPVVSRSGAVLGGLFCGHERAGVFTERTERLVEGIAAQAAIALDNARLYEAERTAREAAEGANKAKDEFLSVLSHELRTPLTPIIGYTEMLRRRRNVSPETLARAIEVIDRSARMQARLVSDLLDVSRIITGKLDLDLHPVDLGVVMRAAVEALRPEAVARSVQLHTHLEIAARVIGDSDRLQQVFWNLLSNAIKFTPEGGQVHVWLDRDENEARITVQDTGKGIAPALLPHVFERFWQADSSSTRAYGGLGLGLAIVRHLVEAHGGRVSAESAGPGTGATFRVWLPLALPDRETGQKAETTAPAREKDTSALAGVRVLLVEDEPDTRALLRLLLEGEGATVTEADGVTEALACMDASVPDVLLADIGMPEEDGYSLIAKVRARPPEQGGGVPAVALTAYASTDDRRLTLAAGFQRHLAKPVDPAAVIATLAELVGRRTAPVAHQD